MRSRKKTQRSKRGGVKMTIPSTRPTALGMPPKPDKRREFQTLYDSIASTHSREQFSTWFKEAKLIESGAKTKSDEFLNYVADIEKGPRAKINESSKPVAFRVYRPDSISKPSPIGQGAKLRASAKAYMNRAEELFSRIE